MNPAADITRILRSLRWRMVLGDLVARTVRAALFFYGLLLALTAAAWWLGEFAPNPEGIPFMLGWPLAFGTAAGLVLALIRFPAMEHVARTADRVGGTRDRLLTGLLFSRKSVVTEIESLAVAEADGYARGRDFRRLFPIRVPQEFFWLLAPLAMIGLLWWDAMQAAAARDRHAADATAEIAGTAGQLERLAGNLEAKALQGNDADILRIADRLRRSAEQMRAEAARGGDAQKAALRELAMLEQMAKELRQPEAATPDELKALADALMRNDRTRPAADDMKRGDLAEAAKKLGKEAASPETPPDEQMRQTIRQALDHLAQREEETSKQMERLREQARADEGGRQELLQQIADLLKDVAQQGNGAGRKDGNAAPQKGGGKPMSDEDLKKLLGALQDMKHQQQGRGAAGAEPGEGEGDPQGAIAMLNFGKPKNADANSGDGVNFPSGQPGTDKDRGTTQTPFGNAGKEPGEGGKDEQARGRLGEGESLSVLVPGAAGGDAKAVRRYKELYEAAAGDAEATVTQENIPLGSRFLIKRYFEAIRPRQ